MIEVFARLQRSTWASLGFGAALLVAAGCPSDDTPTVPAGSSGTTMTPGDTTATTVPPADSTTGPGCGTACPEPATSSGTTVGTTAGTTGTDTDVDMSTTSGSSSGSGTTMGVVEESTGTTDGLTATDSGTDTMGFIQNPDFGGSACDLWLQDCPQGEKCMPWANNGGAAWNDTTCSPIDPNPAAVGDVCVAVGSGVSGVDNCDAGAMCWDVDAVTNEGTCVEMCTGTPQAPICTDPNTSCTIANNGLIILCLPGCDPLMQNCQAGQGCYLVNDAFICAPDASGGAGVDGDLCEFINVCDPGLFCAGAAAVQGCAGAVGCCTPFCDVQLGAAQCPAVQEDCVPVFAVGMAPPGLEDVGICALP